MWVSRAEVSLCARFVGANRMGVFVVRARVPLVAVISRTRLNTLPGRRL
jgi:hypothetical protein